MVWNGPACYTHRSKSVLLTHVFFGQREISEKENQKVEVGKPKRESISTPKACLSMPHFHFIGSDLAAWHQEIFLYLQRYWCCPKTFFFFCVLVPYLQRESYWRSAWRLQCLIWFSCSASDNQIRALHCQNEHLWVEVLDQQKGGLNRPVTVKSKFFLYPENGTVY